MNEKLACVFNPRADRIEMLIRAHCGLVHRIARRVKLRIGELCELEELQAVGRTALFLAARDHDASLAPFAAYATKRIRWAMIDAVRRETHARRLRTGPPIRLVPFEDPETEDDLGTRRAPRTLTAREAMRDPRSSPEDLVTDLAKNLDLLGAMSELDCRDRMILERHYFHDEAFEDIARSIALSKSWLSRIHARAIERLGAKLLPGLYRGVASTSSAAASQRPPAPRSVVERTPEASCDSKKASSSSPEQHKVSVVTSSRASPKLVRRSRRGT